MPDVLTGIARTAEGSMATRTRVVGSDIPRHAITAAVGAAAEGGMAA